MSCQTTVPNKNRSYKNMTDFLLMLPTRRWIHTMIQEMYERGSWGVINRHRPETRFFLLVPDQSGLWRMHYSIIQSAVSCPERIPLFPNRVESLFWSLGHNALSFARSSSRDETWRDVGGTRRRNFTSLLSTDVSVDEDGVTWKYTSANLRSSYEFKLSPSVLIFAFNCDKVVPTV